MPAVQSVSASISRAGACVCVCVCVCVCAPVGSATHKLRKASAALAARCGSLLQAA